MAKQDRRQQRRENKQDRREDQRAKDKDNKKDKDSSIPEGPLSGGQFDTWSNEQREAAWNKYLTENLGLDPLGGDTDYQQWLGGQYDTYDQQFQVAQGQRKSELDRQEKRELDRYQQWEERAQKRRDNGKKVKGKNPFDKPTGGAGLDYWDWLKGNVKGNALGQKNDPYQNWWSERNQGQAFTNRLTNKGFTTAGDSSNPFARWLNSSVLGDLQKQYGQQTGTGSFNQFLKKQDFSGLGNQFKGLSAGQQGRSPSAFGSGPARWSTF
jgi:hypothetical protein